jgi:hypothetical protein
MLPKKAGCVGHTCSLTAPKSLASFCLALLSTPALLAPPVLATAPADSSLPPPLI